jgi:hypothetical protein
MQFSNLAIEIPDILLPKQGIDLRRWSVIACDQYTSEPEYWETVDQYVGGEPSTLRLIFPEVFLGEAGEDLRIDAINSAMHRYLDEDILVSQGRGFILIDRQTSRVPSRKGLIVALDLEAYDYRPGAKTLIRATEGTIVDRLPPRIRVRQNAAIELPHIMVLIDDPEQTVIEPLFDSNLDQVYDFELMQQSGHLKGWKVNQPDLLDQVRTALSDLAETTRFQQRYGVEEQEVLLYAMGDGNHSFATAKSIWEALKAQADDPQKILDHPARYALVELVNVHDPGLEFEAIHRLVFGVNVEDLLGRAISFFQRDGARCSLEQVSSFDEILPRLDSEGAGHRLPFVSEQGFGMLRIEDPKLTLEVATLQQFLDDYQRHHPDARIDYIHGSEAVSRLGSQPGNMGFYLPTISKHDLFRTIVLDGALPRKTFSMGEADEKRFYLEARRIRA